MKTHTHSADPAHPSPLGQACASSRIISTATCTTPSTAPATTGDCFAAAPALMHHHCESSHRRCRFVSFWGRDRLRAQFRMVELLEQQQHVMQRIVADEWTAHAGDGPAVASSSSSSSSSATTTATTTSTAPCLMSAGDVVFISGATGHNVSAINGAYDRTSKVCGGYALYAKRGDVGMCIEHRAGDWQVKHVSSKGKNGCTAYVAGGCGLEACTSRVWKVCDGDAWNDAPSVKLVAGAKARRQVRGGCLRARQHAHPPQLQPALYPPFPPPLPPRPPPSPPSLTPFPTICPFFHCLL
jgi:hypothetical protein